MIDIAIIPVAGRGTSLLPLTKSQPKEMLPVGCKPVVQYVVEELIACQVNHLLFVTGPDKSAIENHFDINHELIQHLRYSGKENVLRELAFEREDASYFFTRQRHSNGLGHAVLCAKPFIRDNPFVVALGDTILGLKKRSRILERMIALFEQEKSLSGIIAFDEVAREDVVNYGIAEEKKSGTQNADFKEDYFELADLIEKPSIDEAPSRLAVAARYVFSPEIFGYISRTPVGFGNALQLTDAVQMMIRDGKKFLGVRIPETEKRYDIGNFDSYFRAVNDFIQ
ncbi:MAG: UTP--glucose-1-phosphate uridylyltransferase [Thermoguttaceae bacterium]